jgi:hypothetical protein
LSLDALDAGGIRQRFGGDALFMLHPQSNCAGTENRANNCYDC